MKVTSKVAALLLLLAAADATASPAAKSLLRRDASSSTAASFSTKRDGTAIAAEPATKEEKDGVIDSGLPEGAFASSRFLPEDPFHDDEVRSEYEQVEEDDEELFDHLHHARHLTAASAAFQPLLDADCNAALPLDDDACTVPVSSLVVENQPLVVPCGTCAVVDVSGDVELHGINIEGKVVFPTNHKVTIRTPYVFVQGELVITSDQAVSPENQSVKFILTGTDERTLTPHTENAMACASHPGGTCPVGKKPFIVAGGKLNIRALPENCPTWVKLEDIATDPAAVPMSSALGDAVDTLANCPRIVIDQSFEAGPDGWSGNTGARFDVTTEGDGNPYLKVSDRTRTWQGPFIDLLDANSCLLPDVDYIFSAKVRLSRSDGQQSQCSSNGQNCLKLITGANDDRDRRYEKATMRSSVAVPDGTWFDFTATIKFNSLEADQHTAYNVLYVNGPEAGVDIDIDDVVLALPPEAAYVTDSSTCLNLFPGMGPLPGAGRHPFPLRTSRDPYTPLVYKEEVLPDNTVNTYLSIVGRWDDWASLTWDMNPECFVQDAVYKFTGKFRIQSENVVTNAYMELRSWRDDGGENTRVRITSCPPMGGPDADVWVECTGGIVFNEDHHTATKFEWWLRTGSERHADVDYDDISFEIMHGPPKGIILDKGVELCWGEGSDVLVTSHTLSYEDQQTAQIESVVPNSDGKTVTLKLTESIVFPTTRVQSEDYASEVALLSRNVQIESANDDTTNDSKHGGYLSVFHTPLVTQLMEGVELRFMGQQGNAGKFPIHFRMCGDVTGSTISKNSIRNSHQRCVVLHNTHGATVSENTAFDTAGHCYVLQDGGETKNTFERNLGALTKKVSFGLGGEHDYRWPATFFCSNPNNHWIGNVAAGSYDVGYKFDLYWKVHGESKPLHDKVNPRRLALGTFSDNSGHSNRVHGLYAANLENMDEKYVFENSRFYRNRYDGARFYACRNVAVHRGILADNRNQLTYDYSDSMEVSGAVILGKTSLFEDMVATQGTEKFCPSNNAIIGIKIMTHRRYTNPEYRGVSLSNLHLEGFDSNECTGSAPISFYNRKKDAHWDYTSSFKNVTIEDSRNMWMDACSASDIGVSDMIISDKDSSFNPDASSTFSGASSIVSSSEYMTTFAGGTCTEYENQCFTYCENTCLRTVNFFTERSGTEDWTLHVTNADGKSIDIPGLAWVDGRQYYDDYFDRTRRFAASLPAGSYTAEFRDGQGNLAWPVFAEELWEPIPHDCTEHATLGDVSLNVPNLNSCHDLIQNGDMESGTYLPFHHTGGNIQYLPGKGVGASNAIGTVDRNSDYHALGQFLPTNCLTANVAKQFEIKAWVKLVTPGDNGVAVSCDPNEDSYSLGCPEVTFRVRYHRDPSTKDKLERSYPSPKAEVVRPYNKDGFNLLHGIFTVDQWLADMESVFFYAEKFNKDYELILDDVSVTPFEADADPGVFCDNLISNGDFKTGNSMYWDTYASAHLEMTEGVEGAGDFAIKAYKRTRTNAGPRQDIKIGCLTKGERYITRAKYKLEKDNQPFACNPYSNVEATRCPEIVIRSSIRGTKDTYKAIAFASAGVEEAGFSHIAGVFTATEHQATADVLTVWFEDEDEPLNTTVDDVSIQLLPKDCSQLVLNPSFEDGVASFWEVTNKDHSQIGLFSPGSDGSQYALRNFDRSYHSRGIEQQLDERCIVSGEVFGISAKFRLLNSTGGDVLCDASKFSGSTENCPSVHIKGSSCEGGSSKITVRKWNELLLPWNPSGFNDFYSEFSVDDVFATCQKIKVYVKDVNMEWDIIVDDLTIAPKTAVYPTQKPTSAPTEFPTTAPTSLTKSPTVSPTTSMSPSTMPSSAPTMIAISCPLPDEESQILEAGAVSLSIAGDDTLCTLTKVNVEGGAINSVTPMARSYGSNEWEMAAGSFATSALASQAWRCYPSACEIDLPALLPDEQYLLTSYTHSLSDRDEVARLLESTTFGPTTAELDGWDYTSNMKEGASAWLRDQMDNAPMTLHREFFRMHANPRWNYPTKIGIPVHPCSKNSRWRTFAFTEKDGSQEVKMKYLETIPTAQSRHDHDHDHGHHHDEGNMTDHHDHGNMTHMNHTRRTQMDMGMSEGPYVVLVNSQPCTVVTEILFKNSDYVFNYTLRHEICRAPEPPSPSNPSGRLWLSVDGSCQEVVNGNFIVNLETIHDEVTYGLHLDPNHLEMIDEGQTNGQEFILVEALNDPICQTLPTVMEEDDPPIFGHLPNGTWLQHDSRLVLEKNTLQNPIPDGGGSAHLNTGEETLCSNVPRTFLNSEHCVLSQEASTCGSNIAPTIEILLDDENILRIGNLTGRYVYAILGLKVKDDFGNVIPHPCTPGFRSRWTKATWTTCPNPTLLHQETHDTLVNLLGVASTDTNPNLRDVTFPSNGAVCNASDTDPEIQIQVGGDCYTNVHPHHLSVFDMTYWTRDDTHPGNMHAIIEGHPNPITKWADLYGSATLAFPSDHPTSSNFDHSMTRWDFNYQKFNFVGRHGDHILFRDLPNELRLDHVQDAYQEGTPTTSGLVCGSPGEVQSNPLLGSRGHVDRYDGFDLTQNTDRDTRNRNAFDAQREVVWTTAVLSAPDQLRQRMAWALSQILVVVKGAISSAERNTEIFLAYYDIFVRNAFTNYFDVLKEISYSPLMAENLSFLQSKSSAYIWERDNKVTFADENFAREIMQLFSIGFYVLNMDGTPKLDVNGNKIQTYTNDDIISFARAWTGFDMQKQRGNTEDFESSGNRLDPMKIVPEWRDRFPKTDLNGGYIGDRYPLCVDLPEKAFLKKGARYRLLGGSGLPELVEDDSRFAEDDTIKRFELNETSLLKNELLSLKNEVVLQSNLDCRGPECEVDTVRVVQVSSAPDIFYEYVRLPCVEHSFYNNAKKLSKLNKNDKGTMCASPDLPVASEACCPQPLPTGTILAVRNHVYDGERMTFTAAQERCSAIGHQLCDYDSIDIDQSYKIGYSWTVDPCKIRVKVDREGRVAIVYEMETPNSRVSHVESDSRNYFAVRWDDEYPSDDNDCGGGKCQTLQGGGCLCDTTVSEVPVFHDMPASKDDLFSVLHIGALDPTVYEGYTESIVDSGITAHLNGGAYGVDTIFEVADDFGRKHYLKNTVSVVHLRGIFGDSLPYSFRNPPQFNSLIPTEMTIRDAQYETDAVLEHYFYQPTCAPFVSIRLLQRFGFSNPSPRYVEAVATAFRSGSYGTFGSGTYGDLAATTAAIVLDREARDAILDADPSHGGLREPLMKVVSFMRSLDFATLPNEPLVELRSMERIIGQMAHELPTVFSFFLPEYEPDGPVSTASLVAPEAMLLDMPKLIGFLNGMFSLVRYGLGTCYEGFGPSVGWGGCSDNGSYNRASGFLAYSPSNPSSAEEVIDELSTLLTAGRLNLESRKSVRAAYESVTDSEAALRIAQQLIVTSPEFHSTSLVRMSGEARKAASEKPTSEEPYRAVVFLYFAGGCDSYNMLVPHTCAPAEVNATDLHTQYLDVRQQVALTKERTLPIGATNQVCDTFALHQNLTVLRDLYDEDAALFFANTGVLNKPVTRENYRQETVTQLFGHNTMGRETKRVDPFEEARGTGVMGRIADVLTRNNVKTNSIAIDTTSVSLVGRPGMSPPMNIIGRDGVDEFDPRPSTDSSLTKEEMREKIAELNNATESHSSFFAETWSSVLLRSLDQNEQLFQTLQTSMTSADFPNTGLGRRLEIVAKMIKTHNEREVNRDMYYVDTGGFDTHSMVERNLRNRFIEVNGALEAFVEELKSANLWKNVTLVQTSEFARTLTPNGGDGTDHAWGGNYFMIGGSVKGGQILGTYPEDITDESPLSLGRGRLIPTTGWDQVWNGLAQWMGVKNAADLDEVCPNRDNFPAESLFNEEDMFRSSGATSTSRRRYLRN